MMADVIDPKGGKPLPPGDGLGREGIPTGETLRLTPEQEKARKRRSLWTALALGAFVILIFVITVAKLGANVLVRDL